MNFSRFRKNIIAIDRDLYKDTLNTKQPLIKNIFYFSIKNDLFNT